MGANIRLVRHPVLRYFSSAQGRFTSPEAMIAKKEWLTDPQRWNHYVYVRSNPMRYIDPNREDLEIYLYYGDTRGATLKDNRSILFLGIIGDVRDIQEMNFKVIEVASHELGHSQAFESDGPISNFIKGPFGNLMGEGRGDPWMAKDFDSTQARTGRAIREINRIRDRTPAAASPSRK